MRVEDPIKATWSGKMHTEFLVEYLFEGDFAHLLEVLLHDTSDAGHTTRSGCL